MRNDASQKSWIDLPCIYSQLGDRLKSTANRGKWELLREGPCDGEMMDMEQGIVVERVQLYREWERGWTPETSTYRATSTMPEVCTCKEMDLPDIVYCITLRRQRTTVVMCQASPEAACSHSVPITSSQWKFYVLVCLTCSLLSQNSWALIKR